MTKHKVRRTPASRMYNIRDYSLLTTYKCKHRVTGRPICAIPCDGITEMCEDDVDEQCEGPGLMLVLVLTFLVATLYFVIAFAYGHLRKTNEILADFTEVEEFNMEEWYKTNLLINLSVCKNSFYYKKATALARKYYENAAIFMNIECPKDEYFMKFMGTHEISEYFYDCVDGAISVRIALFLWETMPSLFRLWRQLRIDTCYKTCECILSLTLKYSDLPKDGLLLYIIWIQLVATDTGMFSLCIFWTLASAIVASELMHINTILLTLKKSRNGKTSRILLMILVSPLMPAMYLIKQFKIQLLKKSLLDQLSMGCMDKKQAHLKIGVLYSKINNLNLISAKLHCNENMVENLFQLIIVVIFMLLSYTNSKTVENIDYLFMNRNQYITFILAFMSLMSIIRGQLNFLKANKHGCLGMIGTIITLPYFLVSTTSRYTSLHIDNLIISFHMYKLNRVFAIILLLTPSLGLFNTLHHGRLAGLPIRRGLRVFDRTSDFSEITFQQAWEPYKMDDISHIVELPVVGVVIMLMNIFLFHIFGSTCVFRLVNSKPALLELIYEGFHTIITPPLHLDWEMLYRIGDGKISVNQYEYPMTS